jgi:hypothetical protein
VIVERESDDEGVFGVMVVTGFLVGTGVIAGFFVGRGVGF